VADASEGRLPTEWRLLWVADSLSVQFVAMDSLAACLLDQAQVSRIEGPATPADSAANLTKAYLCSDAGNPATIAWQTLDLPAGGQGKLKAVALDPNDPDSSQVLESNEVTYNGGVDGDYSPVILHASSVHQSLRLEVTAVGSGLNSVSSMGIAALDSTWTLPLAVTARGNASMTGVASVAAILPACMATVTSVGGSVSAGPLVADAEPPLEPESCELTFAENLLPPPDSLSHHTVAIQPKDLAWARGFVDSVSNRFALHLFYIRHSLYVIADDVNERSIGHTWTTDLNTWGLSPADTAALTARAGKFDELHVWAPTIVNRGPTFHMFYTGVRQENGRNNQRIGVATSTDLNTWTPEDDVVLTSPDVLWATKNPPAPFDGQQLRDPFVMADPVHPGKWLMYFVALDSLTSNKMAVGVATSSDLRHWSALSKPFSSTERRTSLGLTTDVESPHVFRRKGRWWMPYTVNQVRVFFETSASSDPTDTVAVNWTDPVQLFDVAEGPLPELRWWHSTEYLMMQPNVEYLAAWRDSTDGNVDIKGIFATSVPTDSFALSCPAVSGVHDLPERPEHVGMSISSRRWGAPEMMVHLELPSPTSVRLAVHDVAGRRLRLLLAGDLPTGVTEILWDGRDDQGSHVPSGIYFARLTYASGARVSKIVMVR